MLSIVLVCALLTYGGVSLFVVVFAVYPFAAEMFRQGDIPKRLIPGTIALGAFTFTMDSLPGTPQIQNIIPTTFFKTDTWAAPWLGMIGARLHPGRRPGLSRLAPARRPPRPAKATARTCVNEPEPFADGDARQSAGSRSLPLVVVGVLNKVFTVPDPAASTARRTTFALAGLAKPVTHRGVRRSPRSGRWRARCSLGILTRAGLRLAGRSTASSPKAARRRSPARCWRR